MTSFFTSCSSLAEIQQQIDVLESILLAAGDSTLLQSVTLKRELNSLIPINRLPIELLTSILILDIQQSSKRHVHHGHRMQCLALVSFRWWRIIVSNPALWTDISAGRDDIDLWLRKSQSALLTIKYNGNYVRNLRFLEVAATVAHRWKIIDILLAGNSPDSTILEHPMPEVIDMRIKLTRQMKEIKFHGFPKLRHLCLIKVATPLEQLAVTRLLSLQVSLQGGQTLNLSWIMTILLQSPQLELLALSGRGIQTSPTTPLPEVISLPSLMKLVLDNLSRNSLHILLTAIQPSKLCSIQLYPCLPIYFTTDLPNISSSPLTRYIPNLLQRLQEICISCFWNKQQICLTAGPPPETDLDWVPWVMASRDWMMKLTVPTTNPRKHLEQVVTFLHQLGLGRTINDAAIRLYLDRQPFPPSPHQDLANMDGWLEPHLLDKLASITSIRADVPADIKTILRCLSECRMMDDGKLGWCCPRLSNLDIAWANRGLEVTQEHIDKFKEERYGSGAHAAQEPGPQPSNRPRVTLWKKSGRLWRRRCTLSHVDQSLTQTVISTLTVHPEWMRNDQDTDPRASSSPTSSSSSSSVSIAHEETPTPSMRSTKINILPRTSARYSALDNGGTSSIGRKMGWKGVAILLGLFVGAVWIINPHQQYEKYTSGQDSVAPHKQPQEDGYYHGTIPDIGEDPANTGAYDEEDEDAAAATDKPLTLAESPKSPETDPDPLKTVHCLSPQKASLPLVQYALMLDAGSTGSRIHIYKFHNCHASPTLEYEVFKMTIPGLSSYATDPVAAAKSLDVLMEEAVKVVPKQLQGCTKVAVKATAGLRLLGSDVSEAILVAVRKHLKEQYPFPLAGKDAVVIMDGKDEGVYAWITANYLLGTIGGGVKDGRPTYAVLDLGGASTQIVFEPTFRSGSPGKLEEGDHKYELTFSGRAHTLYQHSYLGYGLMRARRSVNNLVAFMWDFRLDGKGSSSGPGSIGNSGSQATDGPAVPNPCLSQGTKKVVTLDGGKWSEGYNVTMTGSDVGSFDHCNRVVELVMAKDAVCTVKPCSFNGVYQPNILDTFPSGGILALSYFYDRIFPLLPQQSSKHGAPSALARAWGSTDKKASSGKKVPKKEANAIIISEIATLADRVCAGPESWDKYWGPNSAFASSFASAQGGSHKASKDILAELHDRPEYCLDLTFMHALLRLGYEFGGQRGVRVEKKVDGVELGWCLGATIALLLDDHGEQGLKCIA
ncbi:Guanosine-diphosphatase [Tulasnella sp. 427]|nr:Guanosine-diphosphatase [Tulasnella sp. 427]